MQRANAFGSLTRQLAWMGGAVGIAALAAAYSFAQEYLPGIEWPKPPIITPGKACGEAQVPWIPCTSRGASGMERAIEYAIRLVAGA